MNDGEIIPITTDDVKIVATVTAKGQTIKCPVSRVEKTAVTTEYFGGVEVDGEGYNFKLVLPNRRSIKEATIQFNAL